MKTNEPKKLFTTNIVGGKYKGMVIAIPDVNTTRSSKSILRESLFNRLQNNVIDKNFVEVFAGSGSIGLEALSRGAGACYFIEKNPQVYSILKQNIAKLDPTKAHHFIGDSFVKFPEILKMLSSSDEKTYFYFDPPFSIREGMDDIYPKVLELIATIDIDMCELVIIEHMTQVDLPEQIGGLKLEKIKRFGKSTLSYYEPHYE